MPRPRIHPKRMKVQPFSLILDPTEMAILRKLATKERTSVAAIIRRAIHTVLYRSNPELADRIIHAEVDSFIRGIARKYPFDWREGTGQGVFKRNIVKSIRAAMQSSR